LFGFLAIVAAFFVRNWRALRSILAARNIIVGGQLIALQAGVMAALAVGLLDHYFFNIEFSHMVALFWGVIGLAMTVEAIENREE
jgi:hypothetical protein